MFIIDISDMGSKSFDNLESVNLKSNLFPKKGDENNNGERLSIVIYKVLLNIEEKYSEYNILSD